MQRFGLSMKKLLLITNNYNQVYDTFYSIYNLNKQRIGLFRP